MTVVDASVWVSSLVPEEVHHLASQRWLNEHLGGDETLIAPTLLLAEVAGAIAWRTGSSELGQHAAEEILAAPRLRLVNLDLPLSEVVARTAASLQLRGADAAYVAVAHLMNVPLVTWDQEMQARAGGFIEVVQP